MSELIKTIKCSNCGGDIKIDLDNLLSYCPYCGTTLMFDAATVKDFLVEREKTKQLEIKEEYRLKRIKHNDKEFLILIAFLFILMLIFFISSKL